MFMMDYVNKFSCFLNGDKTEFVFMFSQAQPILNEKGEVDSSEGESVASIVMTAEMADTLQEQIRHLLGYDT